MKVFRSRVTALTAVAVGWVWLTAQVCSGDPTGPNTPVQNCVPDIDDDFFVGATFFFSKPANCPLRFQVPEEFPFAATAEIPQSNSQYGWFHNEVRPWSGGFGNSFVNPAWSPGYNSQGQARWFVNISGPYTAGMGGFTSSNTGYDDVITEFYRTDLGMAGDWVGARVRINYVKGVPTNSVAGPVVTEPYASYTLRAAVHDWRFNGALTWKWYQNNQLVATTSSPAMEFQADGPFDEHTFVVWATDAYGHTRSGSKTVKMGSGCPNGELYC